MPRKCTAHLSVRLAYHKRYLSVRYIFVFIFKPLGQGIEHVHGDARPGGVIDNGRDAKPLLVQGLNL